MRRGGRLWGCAVVWALTGGLLVARAATLPRDQALDQAPPCEDTPPSTFVEGWPLTLRVGDHEVRIFRPQLERWDGNRLYARAALAVRRPGADQPIWGILALSARSDVDEAGARVTLQPLRVDRVQLPSVPDEEAHVRNILQRADGVGRRELGRLDGALPADRNAPAVLLLIDGEPRVCSVTETALVRISNSRALIAIDPDDGVYYLYIGDRWLRSPRWGEPFVATTAGPPGLAPLKERLTSLGVVDLLDDANGPTRQALARGALPRVYVTTTPLTLNLAAGEPGR
jgi:hypothetical protein